MTLNQKISTFADLHQSGKPLVLYNIWDAGSAKVLAEAGATALATGSWSVAGAQGYADGEALPLEFLLRIIQRIVESVDIPLSIDFEGGYAIAPDALAENVSKLIDLGVVGINFEDQRVGADGLYGLEEQVKRLGAIRQQADQQSENWFINARTDVFLKQADPERHAALVPEAIERGLAYAEAGGSGFFVPGLRNTALLAEICSAVPLPVNAMAAGKSPSLAEIAVTGVARISHGPGPFRASCTDLANRYAKIMQVI